MYHNHYLKSLETGFIQTMILRFKGVLAEKWAEWGNRHNKIILQHDNARPHIATIVRIYLNEVNWEILPYQSYSPEMPVLIITSSAHWASEQRFEWAAIYFIFGEEVEKWVCEWIAANDEKKFHIRRNSSFRWSILFNQLFFHFLNAKIQLLYVDCSGKALRIKSFRIILQNITLYLVQMFPI